MNETENRTLTNTSENQFPREFRIDPQYRRSCLYLVIGGWLVIGTIFFVGVAVGNPLDARIWPGLIVFGLAPIALWLYVTTYRLRFDEWGLSRRRFWWWTLWPWESFAAGEVSCFVRKAILARSKSAAWDRWMVFGFFTKPENEFLLEALRRVIPSEKWHAGERLELPTEQVKEAIVGLVLTRKLRVDHRGCAVLWQNGELIPWERITLFRVAKSQQKDMNVFRIEIQARDRSPISGHLNSIILNGKSVGSLARGEETWHQRLREIVPPRCWRYFRLTGELQSTEEGEFRIDELRKKLKQLKVFWRALGIATALLLPLGAWNFVPGMIALWNNPFFPRGWAIVAIACGILSIIQPIVLLGALAYSVGRQFSNPLWK